MSSSDASSTGSPPVPTIPKSLVLAIDGLRGDALAVADTPNLDALLLGAWQPGYASSYTEEAYALTDAATNSGPNHWAIMTGATGQQHGVTGNGDVGEGDGDAFPHYLTLLEADDPSRNTAYLYTWPIDALIPCASDYANVGQDESNAGVAAEIVAGTFEADGWALGTDPDAVFLFLDDVDGAGHASGFSPDNPVYVEEIEEIDAQVGTVLEAILARPTFAEEAWQIVVTTDHGGTGTSHGGMSLEELRIPFGVATVASKLPALPPGEDPGGTRNIDVVPTVLTHFGVPVPEALQGSPR